MSDSPHISLAYSRLDAEELAALVAHLAPRVVGGFIQKIREPDAHTVVFSVRFPGVTTHVVLSCHPEAPRLGVAGGPSTTLPEPSTLGRWLRSVALGRPLTALSHADRVVDLAFPEGRLVAELRGQANLLGMDANNRIKAVAHHPPPGERDLRPGRIWTPPPPSAPAAAGALRWATPEAAEVAARLHLGVQAQAQGERASSSLLQRTRKRLERLRKNVEQDVARTQDAEQWRRMGQLLVGARGLRRGATEAEVTDWSAEGMPKVIIPLEPHLDGPANAARYFERYRKAQAGVGKATERLEEVLSALERLDVLAAQHAEEGALEAALIEAGLHRPPQVARRPSAPVERLPFRVVHSSTGAEIRVGRGGVDNHATTFHHARGNDHWLHARDAAGAHVIVPVAVKGKDPHPETLRDAAALAIHHSKLRGEPGADVMVTQRKHVQPVPGAPGRVTVKTSRTLQVPDLMDRIARLEPRGT